MGKLKLFENKSECCACGACVNICPKAAITLLQDEYGFLYPHIDEFKCVECGLCQKVCAYKNSKLNNNPRKAFVAQSRNTDLKESASGGMFASIATTILQNGGIVFGAALECIDEKLIIHHIKVENIEDLIKLQGSKYVQSDIGKSYQDVKKNLLAGKTVLFSGTPCQVDGLRLYLGKNYDNLYILDIICHGVPNNKIFYDYIKFWEQELNEKIIDFKFRDKAKGWGLTASGYTASGYTASGNKILLPANVCSYYYLFLESVIYRDSCYTCKYANKHRVGDITIGDFWGVEKEYPQFSKEIDFSKGTSCLIVNTVQGEKLLEICKGAMFLKETDFEIISKYNGQLNRPSSCNKRKRLELLNCYKEKGYTYLEKAVESALRINMLKNVVKSILPNCVIVVLKKLLGR